MGCDQTRIIHDVIHAVLAVGTVWGVFNLYATYRLGKLILEKSDRDDGAQ